MKVNKHIVLINSAYSCLSGHRLKSANNKTAAVFKTLSSRRRIILSGTPIQNDLGEFHAMVNFPLVMYDS